MNRRWLSIMLAPMLLVASCASSPRPAAERPLTPEERELAVKSFDQVWETIRDRHFDPNYNGANWEQVRATYRPQAEAATTAAQAQAAMQGAISELNQSHFGIIPREAYEDMASPDDDQSDAADGVTGIHARVSGDAAYVFRVDPGSPAEKAGVTPGWRIDRVQGKPVRALIEEVGAAFEGKLSKGAMVTNAVNARLAGPVESMLLVRFTDPRGRSRSIDLQLAPPPGKIVKVMALPEMFLTQGARTLPSGVGYITFSIFMDPALVTWFAQQVRQFDTAGAPGIIVDLRGNPGGVGAFAMGMGNWFVSTPNNTLGTMTTRTGSLKFVLNPQAQPFKGPVAVLVDETSMSTSEILAGGLQDIGRARVFGSATPGMALPSVVVRLPSGDGFQFAQANYVSADGKPLEGLGVVPDEVVPLDPKALAQGRDPVIEAAERWIMSQRN